MSTFKLRAIATTALVSAIALPGFAVAQVNDEIIITATKREQTLQSTPIAVSVTDAATIERTQVLSLTDLQSVVPSLRVSTLQTSANTTFIIRGFGNGANNPGVEPSVGVFIDGVYRSRSAAQISDLPVLERVEVLRGPQSTLFGKNASAGVVSVISAKPSFEPTGYVELGAGNHDFYNVKGYFSGPISDKAAVSIGGSYNQRDGYARNIDTSLPDINDRDRFNIRGQLLFQPTDNLDIRIIADYSEIDELCCHVTNFANDPIRTGAINAVGGAVANPADPFAYVSFSNSNPRNTVEDGGISLHIDRDFNAFALTSISSYRSNDSAARYDADFSTADLLSDVTFDNRIDTITQELRLTSTGDNVVDWMVGGFYFHENVDVDNSVVVGADFRGFVDLLAGGPAVLGAIEAFNGFAPGSFFANQSGLFDTFQQDNSSYSAFATLDFHINDRLTFTAGANYTDDNKTVSGSALVTEPFSGVDLNTAGGVTEVALGNPETGAIFSQIAAGCGLGFLPLTPANIAAVSGVASCPALGGVPGAAAFGNLLAGARATVIETGQSLQFLPPFLGFPNAVENGRSSDEKLTWTARLAYQATDNVNVYASAATGFKASSWNTSRDSRPFPADAAALGAAGLLQNNQSFGTRFAGPEESTVFEIGLKARFERGAINIAIFDQQIKGFQDNTFLGTGFSLTNAGKQSTQGFEVDATYAPIDPLVLTVAATVLDPVFNSFVNGPGPLNTIVDLSGERPAGIPSVALATSATYTHDFGNGVEGYIRGDYQYESGVQVVEVLAPRRTVNLVNASAGLGFDNGVDLRIWARNLFNDTFFTSAFPGVVQETTVNAYPNEPRTYGVSLKKSF